MKTFIVIVVLIGLAVAGSCERKAHVQEACAKEIQALKREFREKDPKVMADLKKWAATNKLCKSVFSSCDETACEIGAMLPMQSKEWVNVMVCIWKFCGCEDNKSFLMSIAEEVYGK